MTLETRLLGDRWVWPIALGGAHWSLTEQPDDDKAVSVIHAAIDAGVNLLDTARAYTTITEPSHNEALIQRALATHPRGKEILVATKGGHYRAGTHDFPIDGDPATLRSHVANSRRTLAADTLDLYFLHHPDPGVPIEQSAEALQKMKDAGEIAEIGLSNVTIDQIRRAQTVAQITAVENPLSLRNQSGLVLARLLARDHVAFLAYAPFGGPSQHSSMAQAFPGAAIVAAQRDVTIHAVVLGWLLAQAPNVIPIVGANRPESIIDSATTVPTDLTPVELAQISAPRSTKT